VSRLWLPFVVLLWASWAAHGADGPPPFRYCYYLFELPGERTGCSDCYIPLLVTREPLDSSGQPEVAVIVTYERDSVWKLAESPVKLEKDAVQAGERKVRFEGKVYRYQRVPDEEVIRLLEHPLGRLPIHRPAPPINQRNEPLREVLLRDLSAVGKVAGTLPEQILAEQDALRLARKVVAQQPPAAAYLPDAIQLTDMGSRWRVIVPRGQAGQKPAYGLFYIDKATGSIEWVPQR